MARLLDQVEAAARVRGYSRHTVAAYRSWVAAYVRFHDLQHPRDLDADAVLGSWPTSHGTTRPPR
jgi:hypothetical protein